MIELHKLEIAGSEIGTFEEYKFVFGSTVVKTTAKKSLHGYIYDSELSLILKKTTIDRVRKLNRPLILRITIRDGISIHGTRQHPVRAQLLSDDQTSVTFTWQTLSPESPLL